jgi:hypothetical protein
MPWCRAFVMAIVHGPFILFCSPPEYYGMMHATHELRNRTQRWHYTLSPFISSPVISSRSFRPLIHFVPGHFVPGHFVPWSFCPLVISSPSAESTESHEIKISSKCKIPYTHSPEVVAGLLLYDKLTNGRPVMWQWWHVWHLCEVWQLLHMYHCKYNLNIMKWDLNICD